jgi:hypothetical protein
MPLPALLKKASKERKASRRFSTRGFARHKPDPQKPSGAVVPPPRKRPTVTEGLTGPKTANERLEEMQQKIEALEAELQKLLTAGHSDGPGVDSREAGLRLVAEMQKAEGGAWSGSELATRFGLTPATLHRRRKEHRIVSWRDARHEFYYPKWQFTNAGALLPGIQDVLQTFRSADEWRVMRYFLAPRDQLGGRTPLALLRSGEVDKVLAHAAAHEQENTW